MPHTIQVHLTIPLAEGDAHETSILIPGVETTTYETDHRLYLDSTGNPICTVPEESIQLSENLKPEN